LKSPALVSSGGGFRPCLRGRRFRFTSSGRVIGGFHPRIKRQRPGISNNCARAASGAGPDRGRFFARSPLRRNRRIFWPISGPKLTRVYSAAAIPPPSKGTAEWRNRNFRPFLPPRSNTAGGILGGMRRYWRNRVQNLITFPARPPASGRSSAAPASRPRASLPPRSPSGLGRRSRPCECARGSVLSARRRSLSPTGRP